MNTYINVFNFSNFLQNGEFIEAFEIAYNRVTTPPRHNKYLILVLKEDVADNLLPNNMKKYKKIIRRNFVNSQKKTPEELRKTMKVWASTLENNYLNLCMSVYKK